MATAIDPADRLRLGSDEHRRLTAETFLATHRRYDPRALPWPDLSEPHLERLRAIPFWTTALGVEQNAGRMVCGFARTVADPLFRRVIDLQGVEEARHALVLESFLARYDLPVTPPPLPTSPPTTRTFHHFGYEECLDAYFGFGIFGLARRTHYLPEALLRLFEPILEEEARHIVFFVNWVACERVREGLGVAAPLLSTAGYLHAIRRLVATAAGGRADGTGFLMPAAPGIASPGLTLRDFLESCDTENRRFMSVFDARLLQPRALPALGAALLRVLPGASPRAARLAPQRAP